MTKEELVRAKAQLKAGILMSMETTTTRAEQNAAQLLAFGRLKEKEEILDKIVNTTEDDVTNLAERMFSQTPSLACLGPVKHVMSYDKLAETLK